MIQIVEAGASADFAIEAAAGDGEPEKLPSFSMTAYTGGKLSLTGWPAPVVVDLAGVRVPAKSIPILIAHNHENPLGHTDTVEINAGSIRITGTQSMPSPAANAVIQAGRNKFPWQASIGAVPIKAAFVEAGESVEANNRTFRGPLYVVRSSVLRETSFVTLGADGQTSAVVAACSTEGEMMKFAEWLKARGLDESTIEASALELLKADFEALEASASEGDEEPDKPDKASVPSGIEASRKLAGDEIRRQEAITKLTNGYAEIRAEAIEKGWTVEAAELAVLRAKTKSNPSVSSKGAVSEMADTLVIEAAIAGTCGLRSRETEYDEQTLEASDKLKGFGLQEIIAFFACRNGYTSDRAVLRGDGAIKEAIKAAFSTNEISTTLSNIANKFSRESFMAVEQVWRLIASIRSASNFQAMTAVSLSGDMTYKKVNPQGQITHGKLGEVTYTNKVDEFGRMLGVSRQDIVNDNTGALASAGRMMGRGGGLAIAKEFWAAFTAAGFFSGTAVTTPGAQFNANLVTSNALSLAGLTAAEAAFLAQVDPYGEPIGSVPKFLLTGPALKRTALNLMQSTTLLGSTNGAANTFAGNFEPIASAYLTGTSWYLLADPADIPVMEVAFLNGQEEPVVESFDPAPDQLGMLWRGVYDFGCARVEPRGGVKSNA